MRAYPKGMRKLKPSSTKTHLYGAMTSLAMAVLVRLLALPWRKGHAGSCSLRHALAYTPKIAEIVCVDDHG